MSETGTGKMYGFDIPNPPNILDHGQFISTPTTSIRVADRREIINTLGKWDHHSGFMDSNHYWGSITLQKASIITLDFHWESLCDMVAESVPQDRENKVTEGIVTTDSETHSFTKSIGAEVGGEGKGLSGKLSASLSQTDSTEHSVSISKGKTNTRIFHCPKNTTIQVWQLIATFSHTETIPPFASYELMYHIANAKEASR